MPIRRGSVAPKPAASVDPVDCCSHVVGAPGAGPPQERGRALDGHPLLTIMLAVIRAKPRRKKPMSVRVAVARVMAGEVGWPLWRCLRIRR